MINPVGATWKGNQVGFVTGGMGGGLFVALPSSIDPQSSLTVSNSSSSHVTLFNMLVATVIFMPIILAYTAWV